MGAGWKYEKWEVAAWPAFIADAKSAVCLAGPVDVSAKFLYKIQAILC